MSLVEERHRDTDRNSLVVERRKSQERKTRRRLFLPSPSGTQGHSSSNSGSSSSSSSSSSSMRIVLRQFNERKENHQTQPGAGVVF